MQKIIAKKYGCSTAAIFADISAINRPTTKETVYTTKAMRKKIYNRDGEVCQYCGTATSGNFVVEHIIPAAIGGVAKPYNLTIACQRCNTKKMRSVWVPSNLDEITKDNPMWRAKVLDLVTSREKINTLQE